MCVCVNVRVCARTRACVCVYACVRVDKATKRSKINPDKNKCRSDRTSLEIEKLHKQNIF